jgi:hypothetical protein
LPLIDAATQAAQLSSGEQSIISMSEPTQNTPMADTKSILTEPYSRYRCLKRTTYSE